MRKKIKSVAIIEPLFPHWTTVSPLVFTFLKNDFKVTCLINSKLIIDKNKFLKEYDLIEKSKNLNFKKISFLNLLQIYFDKLDFLIVADRFFKNKFKKKFNLYLFKNIIIFFITRLFLLRKSNQTIFIGTTHIVDNINLKKTFLSNIKIVDFFLNKLWLSYISRIQYLNVYSSLVQEKHVLKSKKKILLAPNAFYKPLNSITVIDKIKIIIPGRIDMKRRNYDWIDFLNPEMSDYLDILLIGRFMSQEDKSIVVKLENLGFEQKIDFKKNFFSYESFNNYLEKSNIIFSPLKMLSDKNRSIDRNLGSFRDSIGYGKPLLIPSNVPVATEFKKSVSTYTDNEDLMKIFKKLKDHKFLEEITISALKNAKNYNNITTNYLKNF